MNGWRTLSGRLSTQANLADGIILLPFVVPVLAQYYLRFRSWLHTALGGATKVFAIPMLADLAVGLLSWIAARQEFPTRRT